jgi:hypothetical protein
MASSSSSPLFVAPLGHPVTEKLTRNNFPLWKAQVLPAIRGAQLEGFLDGTVAKPPLEIEVQGADGKKTKVPNEAYNKWVAYVLSYLLSALSKDILTHIANKTTAVEAWASIEELLASQTPSTLGDYKDHAHYHYKKEVCLWQNTSTR